MQQPPNAGENSQADSGCLLGREGRDGERSGRRERLGGGTGGNREMSDLIEERD